MKQLKTVNRVATALLIIAATPLQVLADEARISDGITPGDSSSKWLLGASIGEADQQLVGESADSEGFFNINLEYRGETVFVGKDGGGYNLYKGNGFSAGIALTGWEGPLWHKEEFEDNDIVGHLKERQSTIDLGAYLIHNSDLGQLRVRILEEITGKHDGRSADASYTFDLNYRDWRINPYIAATFITEDSVNYFYGVEDSEATDQLVAYQGENTINLTTGISARKALSSHWELGFSAKSTLLGDGIANSSLVKNDSICEVALSINYNF